MKEKITNKVNYIELEIKKAIKPLNLDGIKQFRTEANEKLANTEIKDAIRELKSKAISVWGKIKNFALESKQPNMLPEIPDLEYALETTTEYDVAEYRAELDKINVALKNPSNSNSEQNKLFSNQRELYSLINQINAKIKAEKNKNRSTENEEVKTIFDGAISPKQKGEYVNIDNSTRFDKVISKYSEYKNKLQNLFNANKPNKAVRTRSKSERSDQELAKSLKDRKSQSKSEMFTSENGLNNITSFKRSKDPFRYANPKQGGIPMKRQKTAGSAN